MIDLVYDTIDTPFGIWFETVILDYSQVQETGTVDNLHHAIALNALSSFYEANLGAYKAALDKALAQFATIK